MQRTSVRGREEQVLLEGLARLAGEFVTACNASCGDLAQVEQAGAQMLQRLRALVMGCGVRVSAAAWEAQALLCCPQCGRWLDRWGYKARQVMTSQGPADYRTVRYRCRRCRQDHYPLEERNALTGQRLSLGARQQIAALAAQTAFGSAATLAAQMGLSVSASEVDRVAREVSAWRQEEEQRALEGHLAGEPAPVCGLFGPLPSVEGGSVLVSVDGAKVRSPERRGGDPVWYEARASVVAAHDREGRPVGPTLRLGGVQDLDTTFLLLAATVRQSTPAGARVTFVSDDGAGLAERARLHFADAVHTLDIYHAGEHVGSAGAALFGEQTEQAAEWRRQARAMLLAEDGAPTILRRIVEGLREPHGAADRAALVREFRYLWRNRHRMRYRTLRAQGVPVSSAAMESGIKQLCTQRLRQPGMMWTPEGADAMLRLRAALLSGQLPATVRSVAQAHARHAQRYYPHHPTEVC